MPMSFTGMPRSRAIASAMPPFAVPSSFVSTMPVTGVACENSSAWRRPFWPVVASTVSSVSCGAPSSCLAITRRTFVELGHQVVLGVQAPGGVDDHDVGALLAPAADRLERDRAGVALGRARDDLAAGAPRPLLELLDGGGAERVGGAEHDAQALVLRQVPGELADRRRLAGPVDAGDHDHGRRMAQVDAAVAVGPRLLGEQLDQPRLQRRAALDARRSSPRARAARRPPPSCARRRRP